MSNRFSNIPDFNDDDTKSVATSVRSMKLILDILTGNNQGGSRGVPIMFVQQSAPTQRFKTKFEQGDLWICTNDDTMNYWTGTQWRQLKLA